MVDGSLADFDGLCGLEVFLADREGQLELLQLLELPVQMLVLDLQCLLVFALAAASCHLLCRSQLLPQGGIGLLGLLGFRQGLAIVCPQALEFSSKLLHRIYLVYCDAYPGFGVDPLESQRLLDV